MLRWSTMQMSSRLRSGMALSIMTISTWTYRKKPTKEWDHSRRATNSMLKVSLAWTDLSAMLLPSLTVPATAATHSLSLYQIPSSVRSEPRAPTLAMSRGLATALTTMTEALRWPMGRPKIDTKPMSPMLNWEIQDTPSIALPSERQKLALHDQLRRFRQQRRPNIAKLDQLPEVSLTVESSDWECTKLMSCMRVYLLLLRAFNAEQEKLFIVEDNSSVYLTTLRLSFSLLLSVCTVSMIIVY